MGGFGFDSVFIRVESNMRYVGYKIESNQIEAVILVQFNFKVTQAKLFKKT